MSYSKDTYEKACNEINRRRKEALLRRERNHAAAIDKIPEILEVEARMAETGLETIKAIGMGAEAKDYIDKLAKKNLDAQMKRQALLVSNGFPKDWLDIKYTCPECEDTGSVNGYVCGCFKNLLRSIEYEKLCSKLPLDKCRFDNFRLDYYPAGSGISPRKRMENVLDYCKAYAGDFSKKSPSLFLYGMTGLGKTHLSLAIAGEAVKKGCGVIYTSAQNLFSRLEREKFGRTADENTEESILECDLLIIDDLGAEFITQFTISALYNIVNCRILENKPTIISTNLTPDMITDKYTDRIASRILSNYEILRFDGNDIRQIKNNI